jgi:hypothetical protein
LIPRQGAATWAAIAGRGSVVLRHRALVAVERAGVAGVACRRCVAAGGNALAATELLREIDLVEARYRGA